MTVNVVGKQWSWDFNYVEDDVHEVGTQAILTGEPGAAETIPTLYLPVGERVEFVLTARDVIHSFWVPAFLQKMDMIPGRVNRFQVVPTQEGTFGGKCAELCGAYHSQMLFNVKVVRGPSTTSTSPSCGRRARRAAQQHAEPDGADRRPATTRRRRE